MPPFHPSRTQTRLLPAWRTIPSIFRRRARPLSQLERTTSQSAPRLRFTPRRRRPITPSISTSLPNSSSTMVIPTGCLSSTTTLPNLSPLSMAIYSASPSSSSSPAFSLSSLSPSSLTIWTRHRLSTQRRMHHAFKLLVPRQANFALRNGRPRILRKVWIRMLRQPTVIPALPPPLPPLLTMREDIDATRAMDVRIEAKPCDAIADARDEDVAS